MNGSNSLSDILISSFFGWPSYFATFYWLTDKMKYSNMHYLARLELFMTLELCKYSLERQLLTYVRNWSILALYLTGIVLYFDFEFTQQYSITYKNLRLNYFNIIFRCIWSFLFIAIHKIVPPTKRIQILWKLFGLLHKKIMNTWMKLFLWVE